MNRAFSLDAAGTRLDLPSSAPLLSDTADCETVSAAVSRGQVLAIATVERIERDLVLRPDMSGFYELRGREQGDLLDFSRIVAQSLEKWGVDQILVRISPPAGSFMAKAASYKIEAALQLMSGLTVDVVSSQAVSFWAEGFPVDLPQPAPEIGSKLGHHLTSAIEAAAYSLRSAWQ